MAIVFALMSSLAWGSADFFGGLMSRRKSAYAVVGASQAIGFVGVSALVFATGGLGPDRVWLLWSVGAAAFGTAGLIVFYMALASGTMGVVSPIAALGGVVPVAAGLLAGEQPGWLVLVGGAVAFLGAVLASGPEFSGAAGPRPIVLAGLAGLCFGIAMVLMAKGSDSGALLMVWGMRLTTLFVFALAALWTRSLGELEWSDLPALVGIGAADAGANYLYGLASTLGLVSLVAVLGSLYPVVTVLLAWWLLKERLQPIQTLGVICALLGVAVIVGA